MDRANKNGEKPMRMVAPALYQQLVSIFDEFHIHPYDIKANVKQKKEGLEILLRYGETFSKGQSRYFRQQDIEEQNSTVKSFFKETAESCKETLIADYYKMMKP